MLYHQRTLESRARKMENLPEICGQETFLPSELLNALDALSGGFTHRAMALTDLIKASNRLLESHIWPKTGHCRRLLSSEGR